MRRHWYIFLVILFTGAASANATTHVITFGSNLQYTPQGFVMAVGDTVEWQGDFGTHPLESVSVPSGAASFSNSTGTSFRYAVTVAGQYGYKCVVHAFSGMVGGFQADAPVGVNENAHPVAAFVYPNPTSTAARIQLNAEGGSVTVYNATGSMVASWPHATRELNLDLSNFPAGMYQVAVTSASGVRTTSKLVKE